MLYAEHIIGLTAAETCDHTQVATIAQRFAAIKASGALRPRTTEKPLGADGNLFELDRLAGDNAYVFLSVGPRYRNYRHPAQVFGFVFDAKNLVINHGALVGPDLLQHYERLLEECIAEAATALPPLEPISDAELAEFDAIAGDDPAMLAYVQAQSVYRDSDIDMAIRLGDMTEPGALEAVAMFQARVGALQAQWRKSGAVALAALNESMEILVPGALPLGAAIYTIEGGEEK